MSGVSARDYFSKEEITNLTFNPSHLLYLIFGRIAFVVLFSIFVVVFNYELLFPPSCFEIKAIAITTGSYLVLSALYIVYFFKIQRSLYWFAFAQILLDVPLWAVLVGLTGGPNSYFVFLYHLSIMLAAVYCGTRGILFTTLLSVFLYIVQSIVLPGRTIFTQLSPFEVFPQSPPPELFARIGVDVFSMLIVAFLCAWLVRQINIAGEKLKRVERIFRDTNKLNEAIVSSVPTGLMTISSDGGIRSFNKPTLELLQLKDGRELRIEKLVELTGLSQKELIEGQGCGEINFKGNDQGKIVEFSISGLFDSKGSRVGSIVHLQDITQRVMLRDEINRMEKLNALYSLSISFAHEIRNPLGSISASAEVVLKSGRIAHEDRKLLEIIVKESKRINSLVTAMLNKMKRKQPAISSFSLRQFVDESISLMQLSPEVKKVRIELGTLPDVDVMGDVEMIKQVFLNVVKNAVESTVNSGGRKVRIDVLDLGDGRVEVNVIDEGEGIADEIADRVFEPFYTTKKSGIGVGLSVSKDIMKKHGQDIGFRNRSDGRKGCIFYFTLEKADSASKRQGRVRHVS